MTKKVLIIDDDENTVKFLSVVLEENGYETHHAFDGKEGFEKIKTDTPDMVVLDVMMPKKSGFTLFNQLRKEEAYKDLPVLMLTGVAGVLQELDAESEEIDQRPFDSLREVMRKQIAKMRKDGLVKPDLFMDKPTDPDAFIEKVKDLIGT